MMRYPLLSILLLIAASLPGRADEASDFARFRVSAKCLLAKAKVHLATTYPSAEEARAAWDKWSESDRAVVMPEDNSYYSEWGRVKGILELLGTEDPKKFVEVLLNHFQMGIAPEDVAEKAKRTAFLGRLADGMSTGIEMGEMRPRKIGDFVKRFGQPTGVASPENFGIKFKDVDKTVVVFCYGHEGKNIFIDEDGNILIVADIKTWSAEALHK